MFADYKKSVMALYRSLKDKRQLSSELENPSPGKLKRLCEKMLRNNLEKRDYEALKDFFNPKNEYDSLEKSISGFDSDKLKPLINLMKGEIMDSTNDENYKLLAVLIGYEPRPYTSVITQQLTQPLTAPPLNKGGDEEVPGNNIDDIFVQHSRGKKPILYCTAILVLLVLLFIICFPPNGCMIWRIDRYHAISCKENVGDSIMVALDEYRLEKFRKIMNTDTITKYSIGRLWYLKTDNKLELFTIGGKHPIHSERQLNILNEEMFWKYFGENHP